MVTNNPASLFIQNGEKALNDLLDIPAQLERIAQEIRSGKKEFNAAILVLTSNESDDYATWFFGEELLYTEAIDTVGSLLRVLETEMEESAVPTYVTVN